MDASEVVVLYNHSTTGCLNAERITSTVPTDNENSAHRPAAWWPELASELGVALGELSDVIDLFRTEVAAAASKQEPTIVCWNLALACLELTQLLFGGWLVTQCVRHRFDVLLNLLFGVR